LNILNRVDSWEADMENNEAPCSFLLGIKTELRRSQPGFALKSFAAVRPAIDPCSKLQDILAKANKTKASEVVGWKI